MHTPMDMDMFSWSFVRPVDQARFEQKWTRTDGTIFLFSVHAVAAASWSAQTAACARSRYSFQVSHSGTRRWRSCGGILACADHVSAFSVSLQNSPSANKHAEYIWIQIKMFISIIPFLPFAGALLHSLGDHFVFSLRAALLAYSCVFLSLFISTCEFNTVNVSPCVAAVCCRPSCRPYGWERSQCWRERTLHWTRCWIWGRDTHKHVCANACRIYTALISLCSVCLCSVWTLYSEQRRVSDEKYWTSWEFNYVMQ